MWSLSHNSFIMRYLDPLGKEQHRVEVRVRVSTAPQRLIGRAVLFMAIKQKWTASFGPFLREVLTGSKVLGPFQRSSYWDPSYLG